MPRQTKVDQVNGTPKARSPRAKPKKVGEAGRPVLYPEYSASLCVGDESLTPEKCKELLGWQEETDEVKFGSDYLFIDKYGKKVRCINNVTNRPLYTGVLDTLVQEHLRRRWRFNGEPLIIGKTGLILNGQHTLISCPLAEQIREMDAAEDKPLYAEVWPEPVTFEKLVVFGVSEDDEVVNTMDTCKPRTLADAIYRSAYFSNMKPTERKTAARMADYAVRFLWNRTWAMENPFSPDLRRTHAESLDFISRHPRLLRAVRHVMEENSENALGKFVSPGILAGVLYLMGCCGSSGEDYRATEPPTEKGLDWDYWEKACEYFVLLSAGGAEVRELRYALGALHGVDGDEGGGSLLERISVLLKGWLVFKDNGMPKEEEDLVLQYSPPDEDGFRSLIERVTIGGIDRGESSWRKETEEDDVTETPEPEDDPTPEEIEDRAEEVRQAAVASNGTPETHPDDEQTVKPAPRPRPVPRKT